MVNSSKPKVAVLLSSFNGSRYIKSQIESILSQEDVFVQLYIRDDGSLDNTLEILSQYPQIVVVRGANIGCEPSFMDLIHMEIEADYYAFADQDDIWLSKKLITAINNMNKNSCEISACNLHLIDAQGNSIGDLFTREEIISQMEDMKKFILCNKHGCVLVWSRSLHKIIQSYKPRYKVAHDMWVNAIGNIASNTYIDSRPYILYRQHGNNTAGYALDLKSRLRKGIKVYLGDGHPHRDLLAAELLKGFKNLLNSNSQQYQLLYNISNYKNSYACKFKLLFSEFINKDDFMHRWLWRICIIFNKY